ncbi:MAG: hypothetical protein WC304_02350 [Candidatus Gracilibacteria bacterium]|jgi:hypothetical protein
MKQFIKDEKAIFVILILALCGVSAFVLTSRETEIFIYGKELMDLVYNISLAVIAAIIFYIFQTYLSAGRIRSIAKKELKQILARTISAFQDAFVSSHKSEDELKYLKFENLGDFLSKKVAEQISINFNLETQANYSPKMSWAFRLSILGGEIKDRSDSIAAKYASYLKEEMLDDLYRLKNEPIVECMHILSNREVIDFQKKYHGKATLPVNLLEKFFDLLLEINKKHNLNVSFSDGFLKSQKGLVGKGCFSIPHSASGSKQ